MTPRITPGEFEWQAKIYTQSQVHALVHSKQYRKLMGRRGEKLTECNWQRREAEQGTMPPDADTMAKHPINLAEEIDKIDNERTDAS